MVWAVITSTSKSLHMFIDQEVKINQECQNKILISTLAPWAARVFGKTYWTFRQDSTPSHGAQKTQDWIRSHVPDFISRQGWPSYSPDLNPIDYSVWSISESEACAKRDTSLASLKQTLTKAWADLPLTTSRSDYEPASKQTAAILRLKYGHFVS